MTRLSMMLAVGSFLLNVGLAVWAWDALPVQAPVHWDFAGRADGYGPKAVVMGLAPGLALLLPVIIGVALSFDRYPRGPTARRSMAVALVAVAFFPAAIQISMIKAALDPQHALDARIFLGGIGLLVLVLGLAQREVGQNGVIGVRTPWTLRDAQVWHRTHRLAAWTMGLGGAGCIAAPWLVSQSTAFPLGVAAVLLGALVPAAASYVYAQRDASSAG